MILKFNGACYTLSESQIKKWSEYQIRECLHLAGQDERKRKILKMIRRYREMVVDCLKIENIDEELRLLKKINLSNNGMKGAETPFKIEYLQ